jgi:hypothetical protein
LIGYFEGIGAERGIAWRLADSLALRRFVGIALDEDTPDHSTISYTRRLIDLDTHAAVFAWVLDLLARRGLIVGKRVAIDATTLEANAAMPPARAREHPQAAVGSCERLQPEPGHAPTVGRGHAAEAEEQGYNARFADSLVSHRPESAQERSGIPNRPGSRLVQNLPRNQNPMPNGLEFSYLHHGLLGAFTPDQVYFNRLPESLAD